MLRQPLACRAANNHLALVQVAYNLLEEPLLQLLLGPHMLLLSPRYEMGCTRFVRPLLKQTAINQHSVQHLESY